MRAHVAVLPRLRDAKGAVLVELSLQVGTAVTFFVDLKIQFSSFEVINVINHFNRQAGTSFGFERAASLLYPADVSTTCPEAIFRVTLKMASAQVVETSVTNNRPSQDSYHPDDLFQSRYATPGFKPISYCSLLKLLFFPKQLAGGLARFGPTLYAVPVRRECELFMQWFLPVRNHLNSI